ncbi:MAG TPA: GNAT family N-acetyltransferase [Tepidiformaceae bacterium]|nr:GNAT family N-acetyltransferase [Tepidiformaceae bacterium]
MSIRANYPPPIHGEHLILRPWDRNLVAQMARWGERGFPYHAFDLGNLRDPEQAEKMLHWAHEPGHHRHFVAVEDGVAVGRVSVNLKDTSGLYLWSVHVPPEHEGQAVCRRMLAVLMRWLERTYPTRDFILSSNSFAEHAHRAYRALGFEVIETRWHHDKELAEELWQRTPNERAEIGDQVRFENGRWEVRAHIFRRKRGARMITSLRQPPSLLRQPARLLR